MLLRRKFAFAVCATALTAPVLSSCGFNYATDQPYTPAAGTNDHSATVKVLNAVIVSGQSGSGTFVAGLSNSGSEAASLTDVVGEGLTIEVEPVEIPAGGFVNLADSDLHVAGEFEAGEVLDLRVVLDNGEEVELEVPVVTNCDEFEGYDTSASAETEAAGEDAAYSCEYAESEGGH
ncbi:hypothetical protein [Nocardioides sp. W7]|uniref:hypothetical protein n=1 Tax=Nocardioides sp. W7 TaxID=2931390 RepID=UPI001FD3E0E6|nr:hypothetical protein [Nocardioides sp. W7]